MVVAFLCMWLYVSMQNITSSNDTNCNMRNGVAASWCAFANGILDNCAHDTAWYFVVKSNEEFSHEENFYTAVWNDKYLFAFHLDSLPPGDEFVQCNF